MFEDKHYDNSDDNGDDVADDAAIEVASWSSDWCTSQLSDNFFAVTGLSKVVDSSGIEGAKHVVSQAHSHEDSWNNDITKTE